MNKSKVTYCILLSTLLITSSVNAQVNSVYDAASSTIGIGDYFVEYCEGDLQWAERVTLKFLDQVVDQGWEEAKIRELDDEFSKEELASYVVEESVGYYLGAIKKAGIEGQDSVCRDARNHIELIEGYLGKDLFGGN